MTLAAYHLDRARTPLAAYNALQISLMRRYVSSGGTAQLWCERLAPAFRRRYAWMLEPLAASRTVPVAAGPRRSRYVG